MRFAAMFALLLSCASAQSGPGRIRGTVQDARSGESLGRVRIVVPGTQYEVVTDERGRFEIGGISPGEYVLQASTVGYGLVKKSFTLEGGETKEFDIALSPDNYSHTETVEVRADPFESTRAENLSELTLLGSEARNLASVLTDDPLRAVQSLPGVTSNDDFDSRFSLRAASFDRIGLYLDDVLLHQPFHLVENGSGGAAGTLTIFNGEMVDQMALQSGAFPVRYGNRTAGALDVQTREGNRERVSVRATASVSNAGVTAEGPLGTAHRGSWLAAARKSYLQYIVSHTSSDPALAFGFSDAQFRLSYDPAANQNVTVGLIQGSSGLDRSDAADKLSTNSVMTGGYQFTLATAGWRYMPSQRFLFSQRLAFLREHDQNENKQTLPLTRGDYDEWVWNGNATWMWAGDKPLEAGWSLRRTREEDFTNAYRLNPFAFQRLEECRGRGVLAGGYVQQSLDLAQGHIHADAGVRWDRLGVTGAATVSPQASLSVMPTRSTRLLLGWGEYAQFPDYSALFSTFGSPSLQPERAIHYNGGIEQRLGDRSRVRVEVYQRLDRDLLFRSLFEPRLLPGGLIFSPAPNPPLRNALRGYARGAEILLQSRTTNKLTGWVSYALGYSKLRDGITGAHFPADEDQRHTVNVYGSYRLRPSVNLSLKWSYGSGFPVPGYLGVRDGRYYLTEIRNGVRMGSYYRADARINKAYAFDRWKITVYAEVVNLSNHANYRYDTFSGYDCRTGQASPRFDKMFPILPSAGVALEF